MLIDVAFLRQCHGFDGKTLEQVVRSNSRLAVDQLGLFVTEHPVGQKKDLLVVVDDPKRFNHLSSEITSYGVTTSMQGNQLVVRRELSHPLKYFIFDPPFFPGQHVAVVSSKIAYIKEIHNAIIRSLCGEVQASSRFSADYVFTPPAWYETIVPFNRPNDPAYRKLLNFSGNDSFGEAFGKPDKFEPTVDIIARKYVGVLKDVLSQQLAAIPEDEEVGVLFSGGIDSTTVLVLLYRLFQEQRRDLTKLKAHSLAIDGGGSDLPQSETVLKLLADQRITVERIVYHVPTSGIDMFQRLEDQVILVEDYKPANLQASIGIGLAFQEIRKQHPLLKYVFTGNCADELGLSYELRTSDSWYRPLLFEDVMEKPLLFVFGPEAPGGRAFNARKGGAGFSREGVYYTLTADAYGFISLSPFTSRLALEFASKIPYAQLIPDERAMSNFKAELETNGLNSVANVSLPVYHKTRLQCGIAEENPFRIVTNSLARQIYAKHFL